MSTRVHTLTVAEVQRLTSDSVAVTFDVPADLSDRYEFRPGQFLTLCREIDGRDERRSYSICAPVGRRPRVGVRLVPGGRFSQWLVNEVRPGDRIDVATPAGTFTPEPGQADHHVLVAAGSGITPVLSIASSLLATSDATVTLLYGNRRADTVMFADELADLKDEYPCRLHLVHVLSRESREPELFSGRLDQDKLRTLCRTLIPMDEVAHWWLCGPYEMVTGAQKVLGELNVPADRVHRELFYVEDTPPATVHLHVEVANAQVRFRVEDHGSGMTEYTLQRAGEPFFTTKPVGSGFGLGLFLARTFAERWGGSLTLASSPAEGTTATLLLPAAAQGAR